MLVLSRKKNESILIDNNIELVIIDIKGEQIKLGINAPKHIKVYRKEIYEDIKIQNKDALLQDIDYVKNINELIKKGNYNGKK